MKSILVSLMMVLNASAAMAANGVQVPKYASQCQVAAIAKLEAQAASYNAVLDASTVQVTEVDDRAWNPYKYVWFGAVAHTANGDTVELEVLTQKPPFRPCF